MGPKGSHDATIVDGAGLLRRRSFCTHSRHACCDCRSGRCRPGGPAVNAQTGAVTPAPSAGVNWAGCPLSNANLNGATLNGANLGGANLTNATLNNANLSAANLSKANLTTATLAGTNLSSADLAGANLTQPSSRVPRSTRRLWRAPR